MAGSSVRIAVFGEWSGVLDSATLGATIVAVTTEPLGPAAAGAGCAAGNKGFDAAMTAIEMARF